MPNFKQSALSRFCTDKKASVAIIVAVMLFLMVGILMMTVDLGRVQNGKTNNQSAIDASVLGAAEYTTRYRIINNNVGKPDDLTDYTRKILTANLSLDQTDAQVATSKDSEGNPIENFQVAVGGDIKTVDGQILTAASNEVVVYACLNVKTGFAAVLGNGESKKVCNTAKASLPGLRNVEVVFALDVSTSMTEDYTGPDHTKLNKLATMVTSVNNVFDTYKDNKSIYWGIVPYSGMVDLGPLSVNIVENDLDKGEPSSALQPINNVTRITQSSGEYETLNYKHRFDYDEDRYTNLFMRDFGEHNLAPGSVLPLEMLQRIPLTSRAGNETPMDPKSISFDDNPPGPCPADGVNCTPGAKFQAYYHHPYDFFLQFDPDNWSDRKGKVCGECFVAADGGGAAKIVSNDPSHPCLYDYENPCVKAGSCKGGSYGEK